MKVNENEILFIYDSADLQQREILAHATCLKNFKIKEFDIQKEQLTQLQLLSLTKRLNVQVKDLISSDFELQISGVMDLDTHDFLDYLSSNLKMLRTPILVYHDHARFVDSQYEPLKNEGLNKRTNVRSSNSKPE
ncbi:hypothetical protein [Ekhidna sp.]|uniref:hypothetical protein n=1 Tax=Ekhidna sp. TaxID=2608089 RepID=UPI003B50A983